MDAGIMLCVELYAVRSFSTLAEKDHPARSFMHKDMRKLKRRPIQPVKVGWDAKLVQHSGECGHSH
jgi:hypothetical protein